MKIGVDVGGSHIGVGIVDKAGNIIAKKEKDLIKYERSKEKVYERNIDGKNIQINEVEIKENCIKEKLTKDDSIKENNIKENIVGTIIQYINELTKENNIDMRDIEYIGIAFPKSLRKGIIGKAVNLGVNGYEIKEEIQNVINTPIYMKNDAKCAAICEKKYGSLKDYKNAVFLTIGTGIGGAAFFDDKLLQTPTNDLFEIGHMIIRKDGIKCNCGKNGCFEKYASITALKKEVINTYDLSEEYSGICLYKFIKEHLQDEEMKIIIDMYVENLYIGLSNIINLFEPEIISIGGSFVYYEDIFLEKLQNKLDENAIRYGESSTKIVMAQYKNDAGIIGASNII